MTYFTRNVTPFRVILPLCIILRLGLASFTLSEDLSPLYLVVPGGKFAFADRIGNIVLKGPFDGIQDGIFQHGATKVWLKKADHSVYIDKQGNVIQAGNPLLREFPEDLDAIKLEDRYGFANRAGEVVIPAIYEDARDFSEGLGAVRIGNKWGFIDVRQNVVIKPQFASPGYFQEGLADVSVDPDTAQNETPIRTPDSSDHCRFINRQGEFAFDAQFDRCSSFSQGLAAVASLNEEKREWRWGYIDKTGRIAIPTTFLANESFGGHPTGDFSEGLAAVRIDSKWGYIDPNGTIVIAAQFDGASEFKDGLAEVGIGHTKVVFPYRGLNSMVFHFIGKKGYIDHSGKFVSRKLTWKSR